MRTETDSFFSARAKGIGKVVGLRPEHCNGERYASWNDIAPVLRLMNAPRRGFFVGIFCPLCRGWHVREREALA